VTDGDDDLVGALVAVEPPAGSEAYDLPWVVTFGPLDEDDDWDPVVCGPYERPHALALAEAVVADDELMAVVEPLLPSVSVEDIRREIAEAQRGAAEALADLDEDDDEELFAELDTEPPRPNGYGGPPEPPTEEEVRAGFARIAARLTNPTD
jgi:hypothetical protein